MKEQIAEHDLRMRLSDCSGEQALALLKTKSAVVGANAQGSGKFFLSADDAKTSFASSIVRIQEVLLVKINCHPLAIGAALMDDGQLKVGQKYKHKCLRRKWIGLVTTVAPPFTVAASCQFSSLCSRSF